MTKQHLHNGVHQNILRELSEYFLSTDFNDFVILDDKMLKEYKNIYLGGIQIDCKELPSFIGYDFKLRLLIPSDAPYAPPKVAIITQNKEYLEWPHVESKGILCLPDKSNSGLNHDEYSSECISAISSAIKLCTDNLRGISVDEYKNEWLSYWVRDKKCSGTAIKVLWEKCEAPSLGYACIISDQWFAADNLDNLTKLVLSCCNKTVTTKDTIRVPLLIVNDAIIPQQFPRNLYELFDLSNEVNYKEFIREAYRKNYGSDYPFILCVKQGAITSMAGGVVIGCKKTDKAYPNKKGKIKRKNYSNPVLPKNTPFNRGSKILKVELRNANRFDATWVHGRCLNEESNLLKEKKIVVFGVGSLGSGIVDLLAKAGVGHIEIVDSDSFDTANASRHVLGCNSSGKSKATEFANNINTRFPATECKGFAETGKSFVDKYYNDFEKFDLAICATGNWNFDNMFDRYRMKEFRSVPALYCFNEANCGAGHCYLVSEKGGCIKCIRNDYGESTVTACSWDNVSQIRQIPMCGGSFQPYGAIALSHIQSLCAQIAVDSLISLEPLTPKLSTWLSDKESVAKLGGFWDKEWINRFGDPGAGSKIIHNEINGGGKHCQI